MKTRKAQKAITPEILSAITERYDTDQLIVSEAYADRGTGRLRGRLEGGALNQIECGDAMASRYAIWANAVRDNVIAGLDALDANDRETARHHLIRAANSLSAFSDIQAYLDPLNMGKRS